MCNNIIVMYLFKYYVIFIYSTYINIHIHINLPSRGWLMRAEGYLTYSGECRCPEIHQQFALVLHRVS